MVKIDRAFLADIPHESNAGRIVTAIVAMAGELGLQVTAEGVETEAQYRFLSQAGCHFGQGFGYARPQPAGDFLRLLQLPEASGWNRCRVTEARSLCRNPYVRGAEAQADILNGNRIIKFVVFSVDSRRCGGNKVDLFLGEAQSAGNGAPLARAATPQWRIGVAPFGRDDKPSSALLCSLELATASTALARLTANGFSTRCIHQYYLDGVLGYALY